MRCPACKSSLSWQDADQKAKEETYRCPKCGVRSAPKYGWILLLVLALVAAPMIESGIQIALIALAKSVSGITFASKDLITVISVGVTAVVLICVYSWLRQPAIVQEQQSQQPQNQPEGSNDKSQLP